MSSDLERDDLENKEKQRNIFRDNFGVSYSTRPKGIKEGRPIEEALSVALEPGLNHLQVDFRNRTLSSDDRSRLKDFVAGHPDLQFSVHGKSWVINDNLDVIDNEEINNDLEVAMELNCGPYTIHPPEFSDPTIAKEVGSSPSQLEKVIDNYAHRLAEIIKQAEAEGNHRFSVAVENVPMVNNEFTIDVLKQVIEKVKAQLPAELHDRIGITLDVNNALHFSVESGNETADTARKEDLKGWFDAFGQDIKCFHLYCPEEADPAYLYKMSFLRGLYDEAGLSVPVFLESKKSSETTKRVFADSLQNLA